MRDIVHVALLKCLEQVALDWEENLLPADIRCCPHKQAILTEVRRLVNDPRTGITPELFNEYAPAFVYQFEQVMLRDLGTRTIPWRPELH